MLQQGLKINNKKQINCAKDVDPFGKEHPGRTLYTEYVYKYKRLTKEQQAWAKLSESHVYRDYIHAEQFGHHIYNQEINNGGKL